jgi:thiosulfate dehydrogenase [quinone] large subunit
MQRSPLAGRGGSIMIEDPPIARFLFSSTRTAWLWLILRLWLGWQWLQSGWGKLNSPEWMSSSTALRGYWERAVEVPETGRPAVTFDWYREFLNLLLVGQHDVWFSKLVLFGELAIGLGLILGAFVGIAAFFGGLMNWSFLMAGTVSTNPVLFAITGLLVLAWKNAGYYGLDRYLLPALGTPWRQQAEDQAEDAEVGSHRADQQLAGRMA